jgi:hypothetical protein
MPDMPQVASKGSILKRLDALSQNAEGRQQLLNELSAPGASIPNIAESHGLVSPGEKQHMVSDWFTNWWPAAQPVEPILIEGFKVALTEAINRNLPLDCYWLCEPGHNAPGSHDHGPTGGDGTVEVAVCWSDRQVTVLIDTPGPGHFANLPELTTIQETLLVSEPIKVIFRDAPGGPVQTVQPKHRP